MDKVDLLFDRFLHFLQGMGKVDPSTSTCCLAVSYLFFGTWTKVDLLFDRFLLVLQSMDKIDPSTSTCCLTVSYLFFRADEYGGGGPQVSHSSV